MKSSPIYITLGPYFDKMRKSAALDQFSSEYSLCMINDTGMCDVCYKHTLKYICTYGKYANCCRDPLSCVCSQCNWRCIVTMFLPSFYSHYPSNAPPLTIFYRHAAYNYDHVHPVSITHLKSSIR